MATVLIVEDEVDYRDPLVKRLEQEGYTVLCAEDGAGAIELIKNNTVDIILLDLILPRMDGVEFLFILKNELKSEAPVIILSNLDSTAHNSEVAEYLVKANTTMEELVKKIATYLPHK